VQFGQRRVAKNKNLASGVCTFAAVDACGMQPAVRAGARHELEDSFDLCGSAPLALLAGTVGLLAPSVPGFADPLLRQTNLVSDVLPAVINDPNLTNAWGLSEGPATPIWVSDNGTGVTTLYSVPGTPSGAVSKVPLTVTIPSGSLATSAPTGQVFNGTASGFKLSNGSKAAFIFDSEDGVISAWNGGLGTNAEIEVNNSNPDPTMNAVYKGLAIDNAGGSLFATNFRSGMVEMYKSDATSQFDLVASFTDPTLPAGYAPFAQRCLMASFMSLSPCKMAPNTMTWPAPVTALSTRSTYPVARCSASSQTGR
jgi:hypothetical protein